MKNVQFISLVLVATSLTACKEAETGSTSASVQSKNVSVPGCDSNGGGISNNPNCQSLSSPSGDTWIRQFSEGNLFSGQNEAKAVALDSLGNVITVGHSIRSFDGKTVVQNHGSSFVIKYDASGNKLWSRQTDDLGHDYAFGTTVDSSDNIYVVGGNWVNWPENNPSNLDIFVRKYDPDGNLQWSKQYGSTKSDWAYSVAVDSSGNLYVGGFTYGAFAGTADPSSGNGFFMKLNNSGDLLWKKQIGFPGVADTIFAVKLDADKNIYVAGPYTIAKYKNDGDLVWYNSVNTQISDMAISPGGDLFISGSMNGTLDGYITKYSNAGKHIWTRTFGSSASDVFGGLVLDSNDNPIACGYLDKGWGENLESWGAVIVKYSKDGDFISSDAIGNSSAVFGVDIAISADNRLVMIGGSGISLDGSITGGVTGFILSRPL